MHAVRAAWGAPETATHCPLLPATSHASHCPSHALSQQTASLQTPEPHSLAAEQSTPFGFAQEPFPAEQVSGAVQLATEQQTPSTQLPLEH